MNKTENYQLSQWEKSDRIQMEDFNSDNAKLDAALAALAGTSGDHTAQLSKLGNCQLYVTSYTGNGTFGSGNSNSLTFPKPPRLVIVGTGVPLSTGIFVRGQSRSHVLQGETYGVEVTWSGSKLSWYHVSKPEAQLNNTSTYYVLAFIPMD